MKFAANLSTTTLLLTVFCAATSSLCAPLKHHSSSSKQVSFSAAASQNTTSFNAGFNITAVVKQAQRLASHSWEYGTLAESLLELYSPEYAVYSQSAFGDNGSQVPSPSRNIKALSYASGKFDFSEGTLSPGDGANGDPAALGVSAILLSKSNSTVRQATYKQMEHLFSAAPRFYNGAISQREGYAELWADGMSMIQPFMAYYGVWTNNVTMVKSAARQELLYQQVLYANTTASWKGLLTHIVGPKSQSLGIWATGNGWAALGMARVLATMKHYSATADSTPHLQARLKAAMLGIFRGLENITPEPKTGLWRNYLVGGPQSQNQTNQNWFGDASGSAALVAAALRLAVLEPDTCTEMYNSTKKVRKAVVKSIDASTGIAKPTVNPLDWYTTQAYTKGSPEGQAFVINMYAAWRDCVQYGCCPEND